LLFLLTTYALCAIQDNSHNKLYKGGLIVFAVVLLIQHVPGLRNYNDDKNEIYSDAQGVAEFIKESGFEHKLLVGHQASVACAILPFLPEVDSMYHGECERFGTYYNYGACLLNNTVVVQPDYAIDLVYKKFKSRMHDAIFIFNYPIQPENRQYMDLIYLTPYPVLRQDESFWIYKFKDNAN
jgi:hypothetical protein